MHLLRLRKKADRRLRAGHRWIYSNEVDVEATPLKGLEPGTPVRVEDASGRLIGSAHANPHTLIAARIYSDALEPLDAALIGARLERAARHRDAIAGAPYYRLAYGDADGLPGLVVDRYGEDFVAQLTSAGMERAAELVVEALASRFSARSVILKNDGRIRAAEGLPEYVRLAHGTMPESLAVIENGVRFEVSASEGQKTGWFYDHRDNRARLRTLAPGRRVLDVFSYAGGWGVQAAAFGAARVLCVDGSEAALALAARNAASNGVADRVETARDDAFKALGGLEERFDLLIVDPPAFIPRKKDQAKGETAYRRLAALSLPRVEAGGLFLFASCSLHLSADRLLDLVRIAARERRIPVALVGRGTQGFDHPVHPAIPETEYLKALLFRVG